MTAAAKLPAVPWADVAAKGGIRPWVDAELARQGLADPGASSSMSDVEKKAYKAWRDEERRVRRELFRVAWAAYKAAHIVHLGPGVWWHDTADVDRFDAADPAKKQQDNALPALPDVEALAKALGLSIARLRWLSYHREVDTGTHYHRWTVPKRDGGLRPISAPKPELKAAQRWIARQVTEHLPVHGAAHGFLPGRSIATNAGVHAGAKIIVKLDIEGFYPTVTWRRVKGLLRKAGLGEQVATIMALVATEAPREELVVRGRPCFVATGPRALPQGAPTSPSITNALCLRLDCRLTGLARKLGARYTRYADDLTFSASGEATAKVGYLLARVRHIAEHEGFTVNEKKTRVQRRNTAQSVTGLVVNERVAPPRKLIRRLRAILHKARVQGIAAQNREGRPNFEAWLRGMIAYVEMANAEQGRKLRTDYEALYPA